ncbi:MAG: hypothetical protein OEZ58_19555 [Gammaproteobacteria bacterium]|nr:hypothetical protein [Gammaproteobacteria bacterium]MDH5731187.1 hypothetical protein [Gammaproteobacteria bacterium]
MSRYSCLLKCLPILILLNNMAVANEQSFRLILPEESELMFTDEKAINAFVSKADDAQEYYQAGIFYFYSAFGRIDRLSQNEGLKKRYMDKSVKLLEKAAKQTDAHPVVVASLADAYGGKCRFLGFPELLQFSKKSLDNYNKAVKIDPTNVDVRYIRLRSFSYYPYTFYKHFEAIINDDYAIIDEWLNNTTSKKSVKLGDDVNFFMARYYFYEHKNMEKAKVFLQKIQNTNDHWYSDEYQKMQKRL